MHCKVCVSTAVLLLERVEHDHFQQGAVDKEGEMAYETKPAGTGP